ncbi:MAG: sporulation initiation factor Spo0A C-terminal domain-containing protein [Evtepia gabavorous]
MTNTEAIIRTILGPIRRDTRPLACSVDCLSELLFVQKIPMDEIMVTKDIYPEVAKQLNKNPRTISRSVERLVLCCWEEGNRAYLAKIIGRNLTTLREPREMLFISPSILTGMSRFSPLSRRSPPCCFEI